MNHPNSYLVAAMAVGLALLGAAKFHAADAPKEPPAAQAGAPNNNDELLKQLIKAAAAMEADLKQKEREIDDFREQHSRDSAPEASNALSTVAQARERLGLRRAEIVSELEMLKQATTTKTDPRSVLILLKRLNANRAGIAGEEGRGVSPSELVKLYEQSLNLEQQLVQAQWKAADARYGELLEKQRRFLAYGRREKDLEGELKRLYQSFLPLEHAKQMLHQQAVKGQ